MFGKSAKGYRSISHYPALALALSRNQILAVSGGGSNVQHGNPGGEPASYNVHTSTGPGPAWYNLS